MESLLPILRHARPLGAKEAAPAGLAGVHMMWDA